MSNNPSALVSPETLIWSCLSWLLGPCPQISTQNCRYNRRLPFLSLTLSILVFFLADVSMKMTESPCLRVKFSPSSVLMTLSSSRSFLLPRIMRGGRTPVLSGSWTDNSSNHLQQRSNPPSLVLNPLSWSLSPANYYWKKVNIKFFILILESVKKFRSLPISDGVDKYEAVHTPVVVVPHTVKLVLVKVEHLEMFWSSVFQPDPQYQISPGKRVHHPQCSYLCCRNPQWSGRNCPNLKNNHRLNILVKFIFCNFVFM